MGRVAAIHSGRIETYRISRLLKCVFEAVATVSVVAQNHAQGRWPLLCSTWEPISWVWRSALRRISTAC